MAATPPTTAAPNPLADNWTLTPLEGSVAGVTAEIARLNAPAHFKTALIADLTAALEGADHNFVKLHAHGTRQSAAQSSRHIILIDLETSKKNL